MIKISSRKEGQIFFAIGLILVFIGIICNEWVLTKAFSPDGIFTVYTKVKIWAVDLTLILIGSALIKHRKSAKSLFINLTILFITTVVLLVIVEFGLRFIFRDVTTTVDNESYFAKRWHKTVRYNTWGFRERDFDLVKPEGVYRIAATGDSITYGQGIEERDRFTNLLEKQPNNENGNGGYEVLNFGRPGAETIDHLDFLNDPVLSTDPDFVLLQWYTNDVESRDNSERTRPLELIPSKLRRNSALFYLLHRHLTTIRENLGWVNSYDDYMLAHFGDPDSASSLAAKETLQKFINISKEQRLPVGIVIFSDSYFRNSRLDFLIERVLQLCEEEAITCLDLRSTFAPYKEDPKLWANRLDPHPSPFANRLVADRLMETFGEVWLSR
jgi:lysophospholipase L1-like esterase